MTPRHIIRSIALAIAIATGGLGSATTAFAQDILVLGAPGNQSRNTEVAAKLSADSRIDSVTVVNAETTTPSLATLQTYDAVLVYSDDNFADATALGDNLHAYVSGGGGVVNAVFTTNDRRIAGAWQTNADDALAFGDFLSGQATLGTIALPAHPVVAGVTSFDGGSGSFRGSGALGSAATLIASWSTGEGFAATKTVGTGTVVTLNFYPPSSDSRDDFWLASTDGDLLMANSLVFSAGAPAPEPVVVPTLTEWAMILMMLALAGSGALIVSRRRQA